MITIHDITNSIFTSKTYILSKEGEDKAWLVDIGDIEPVVEYLEECGLTVAGVFLTHAHFDHVYGIHALVERFPQCWVYCTEYAKVALASEKLNMSKYNGTPLRYSGDNVVTVHEGEHLTLFAGEPLMGFYETPGHNPGCLTLVVGDSIFTGDAYMPGVGTTTTLPYANKEQAKLSMERILALSEGKSILPGHEIGIKLRCRGNIR